MRVIWLCNMIPSAVSQKIGKTAGGGLWVDHVLEDVRAQGEGCSAREKATGDNWMNR